MPLLRAIHNLTGLVVAVSYVFRRRPLRRLPAEGSISLQQRLADLPTQQVPLRRKVQILLGGEISFVLMRAEYDRDKERAYVEFRPSAVDSRWLRLAPDNQALFRVPIDVLARTGVDRQHEYKTSGAARPVGRGGGCAREFHADADGRLCVSQTGPSRNYNMISMT
jgi:hypothetical protein